MHIIFIFILYMRFLPHVDDYIFIQLIFSLRVVINIHPYFISFSLHMWLYLHVNTHVSFVFFFLNFSYSSHFMCFRYRNSNCFRRSIEVVIASI